MPSIDTPITECTVAAVENLCLEIVFALQAKGFYRPSVDFRYASDTDDRGFFIRYHTRHGGTQHLKAFFDRVDESNGPDFTYGGYRRRIFAWIEGLKSVEEQDRDDFRAKLARLIDEGREIGIETDFVNPLEETMKRLSENAIEHHKEAAE